MLLPAANRTMHALWPTPALSAEIMQRAWAASTPQAAPAAELHVTEASGLLLCGCRLRVKSTLMPGLSTGLTVCPPGAAEGPEADRRT
jgi:hypothetical protein